MTYECPVLLHYGRVIRPGRKGAKDRVGGSRASVEVRLVHRRPKLRARLRTKLSRARRGKARAG